MRPYLCLVATSVGRFPMAASPVALLACLRDSQIAPDELWSWHRKNRGSSATASSARSIFSWASLQRTRVLRQRLSSPSISRLRQPALESRS